MNGRQTLLASGMVAAGAALVAAPWVLGQRIEKNFRAEMAQVGLATAGVPVRVVLISYERGFYSSTARTRLELIPGPGEEGKEPGAPLALDFNHRIEHGLGLAGLRYARVTSTLGPGPGPDSAVSRFFGGASPLTVTTRFGLDGSARGTLSSPAAQSTLANDEMPVEVAWSGLSGSFSYDPRGGNARFDLSAPEFRAGSDMGKATLRGLGVKAQMQKSADSGLWLGGGSMDLAHAEASMMGSGFQFEGFSLASDSSEAGGLVSSSVAWRSKRLSIGADVISDFALKLTVSRLDAAALRAYDEAMEQAKADTPEAQLQVVQQIMTTQLPALLAKKPQLSIDEGRFSYNGSALELSGKLAYVGSGTGAFSPMTDLAGEATVVLPRSLMTGVMRRQVEKQAQLQALASGDESVDASAMAEEGSRILVDNLQQGGLLVAEADGRYRTGIKLQAGAVTVNGQPFESVAAALAGPQEPLEEEGAEAEGESEE
ncbi:DUF945 domain-containing protein [Solimonas sp. K1W22B-7]|uniref:YdgA family protein n=1 Tax=Solimonas sp. K1W22B-7 TaxID=2303331 RepID=UPI000E333E99|nr:YdgA family protein [Solimonas sp. K1W22B-7]AXQ27679.1 DUF945 domain-containing protein [Solimonas sp. K1W22B-7]